MNRLILGTCLLLLVIGGWLAEAQIPIVRPIPPHTIGNPISPGNITAPSTGGPYSVTGYDLNGVIDPCGHGFGCNMATDTGVSFTNGSATVTSTSNLWASTDCTGGTGCTGAANKLITLYDGSAGCTAASTPATCCSGAGTGTCVLGPGSITARNTFSGTIVGFTNSGQITISGNYAAATNTGSPSEAIWASDDLAPWNALMASIGATGVARPVRIAIRKPIMTSGELVFEQKGGEIFGWGMDSSTMVNPPTGPQIVWAPSSQVADASILRIKNSWGTKVHDLSFEGSSLYPPWAAINLQQTVGSPVLGGHYQVDHIECGPSGVNLAPGGSTIGPTSTGTMTGNHAIGDTSITLTAAPTGLQANAPVWFWDETAGSEVAFTTQAYVPGANPILLRGSPYALSIAHTAANATVLWSTPSMTNCLAYDFTGTQGDTAIISNVRAHFTDACYGLYGQSVDSVLIDDLICADSSFGAIDVTGGNEQLRGFQWNATALGFYLADAAHIKVDGVSNELGGTIGGNGSPNLLVLTGSGGANFECDNCLHAVNSNMPITGTNADFIDENPAATSQILLTNFILNEDGASGAALGTGLNPSIHVRVNSGAGGARNTRVIGLRDSGMLSNRQLNYVETGTSSSTLYQRLVEILQTPSRNGELPLYTRQILQGSDTFNRSQIDNASSWLSGGPVTLNTLSTVSTQSTTSLTCVGGGTGTDYYFFTTAVDGHGGETPAGAANTTAVNCIAAASMDSSNYIKGAISVVQKRVAAYNIYMASCSDPCGNPGSASAGLVLTVPINTTALSSQAPPAWQYLGTAAGVTPPLYNSTAMLVASGSQQYPNPIITSIAGLPSPCATPGTGEVNQGLTGWWVNNSSASTWGSTPVATATPTGPYPVRCWPDGAWHISN